MKKDREKLTTQIKKITTEEIQNAIINSEFLKDVFKFINFGKPTEYRKKIFLQECKFRNIDVSKLKINSKKIDLTNRIFGYLKVLSKGPTTKSGASTWTCQEMETGIIKNVITSHLLRGKTKSFSYLGRMGKLSNCWSGFEQISGETWYGIKRHAKDRNIEFNINLEFAWNLFLKQEKKCALSGLEISFGKTNKISNSASLDRIDSSKGYIEGNVQWVHKDINIMKNKFQQDYFINLCKLITINFN